MHIESLKNQQIRKSELNKVSLSFGRRLATKTLGHQVSDKALKILGAASAAIATASIALSKKSKTVEKPSEVVDKKSDVPILTSSIATDKDLVEIHKIELEAFSDKYDMSSNFKAYKRELEELGITTYAIKSQYGELIGYYQLEPIKNGELYISSIAVKKGLRGTKTSVSVLRHVAREVFETAKEQNVDRVTLDVNSENKPLVKLYKKFGFEIVDTITDSTSKGMYTDYYMELDFNKYLVNLEKENLKEQKISKADSIEYNEISDEQIENIASEIRENPIYIEHMSTVNVNRQTIPLILNIIENPEVLELLLKTKTIDFVISDSALHEDLSKVKQILIQSLLTDEKYKKLPDNLQRYVLCNVNYIPQLEVLDKILTTEDIVADEIMIDSMLHALSHVYLEKQAELFTKILDDEEIRKNKLVMSCIFNLVRATSESIEPDLVIKCLKSGNVVASSKTFETFLMLLSSALSEESAKLITKILTDDRLNNLDYMQERGQFFSWSLMDETAIKAKELFIQHYLSDEKFYKNEALKSKIFPILENIHYDWDVSANFYMIEEILADERLYKNENVMKNLPAILSSAKKMNIANYKLRILRQIFSDERIANNSSVLKCLDAIIINTQSEEEYYAKHKLIDTVLENEKILNNPIIDKCLGSLLAQGSSIVYTEEQIKIFLNVLKAAYDKKHILKMAVGNINDDALSAVFASMLPQILKAVEMIGETNFIHSYGMKLQGVKDFVKTIDPLKRYYAGDDYEKLLEKLNPEASSKYILLSKTVRDLKKKYPEVKASGDNEKLKELQNQIATYTKEMQEIRKNKVKLDPQQVINKVRTLAAIGRYDSSIMKEFIDLIKDGTKENEAIWNENVNRYIFKTLGVEYSESLSTRLNLLSSKYLAEILSADRNFISGFQEIVDLIKDNPDKSNEEIFDMLPQNIKTKEMFETIGINYEKWSRFDKNSFIKVDVQLSVEEARKSAIEALEDEFSNPAFLELPAEEIRKIIEALNKNGVEIKEVKVPTWDAYGVENGMRIATKLYKDGEPIRFEDLSLIMKTIKEVINSNDFWTTSTGNSQLDSYKDTVYTHLMKDRNLQYRTAKDLKEDANVELEIRKTDMNNISHALFLGNHGACCTAVGTAGNQYSAPAYIKNKMISAIEIVDGGNFVGNTMCYIAIVDGVPSIILDNIELKADYHNNDKIRDALVEYAKKLCAEIGKPDMPIYAGPYRHKLEMKNFEFKEHKMQILGSTGKDYVYLDFITKGRKVTGNDVDNVKLFKIR